MSHQVEQPYAEGGMLHVPPSAFRFPDDSVEEPEAQSSLRTVTVSTQVFVRTILTVSPSQGTSVTQTTGRRLGPVPLTLEVHSDDGAVVALSGHQFFITEADTGDMTFSNEGLPAPWHFLITVGLKTGKMRLELSLNYAGLGVEDALRGLRFFQSLAEGGEFRITGAFAGTKTQVLVLRGGIPRGEYEGPDAQLVKMLERMAFVEEKTGVRFIVPEGEIPQEELLSLRVAVRILKGGRATYTAGAWETISSIEQAKSMLEDFGDSRPKPTVLYYPEEQSMNVFGVDVPLGPVLTGVERTYIAPEDLSRLRSEVAAAAPGDEVEVRLSPYENCPAEVRYMRWLPVKEAAAIYRMPIFQNDDSRKFLAALFQASMQDASGVADRFAALLAELRKNPAEHTGNIHPVVSCSDEELLGVLAEAMKDMPQEAKSALAAKLFEHDVLSSGKAARFAGTDRVSFLRNLHNVGVAVLALDEEEMENEIRHAG
jgi:predicted HTH domain antitoxin